MELGDIVADHENRISEIEVSLVSTELVRELAEEVLRGLLPKQKEWEHKQWDIVNQLRAEVTHIHTEVHEKKAALKGDKL